MFKDEFLFGLNAGGAAYLDSFANQYEADTTGIGKSYSTSGAIAGTVDDTLYQSEVWQSGGFTYDVALDDGTYYVELNFAEIYFNTSGSRVFDILLEGAVVEDDLDIYAVSGGHDTAFATGYFVDVNDGVLNLTLAPEFQNPKLSAFSIWSVAVENDTTVPTVTIELEGGTLPSQPVVVTLNYADNAGLDPATLALSDLVITGPGSYTILSENLDIAPDGLSATASYVVLQDGGWTPDSVSFDIADNAISDTSGNGNAAANATFAYAHPFDSITPVDSYSGGEVGSLEVRVTPGGDIEISTYPTNAFEITNTGDKRIAAVYFDISNALFHDTVFDPEGLAGDNVARGVTYGATGNTGAVDYQTAVLEPFFGLGGTSGYEGMMIRFDPETASGFETGETATFGVDVDPNSIIGIPQIPVDINGADPRLNGWDIGGVSGAELIGTEIEVLFTDGTTATAQLMGDGSEGGAVARVDQASPGLTTTLTVNGVAEGGQGHWDAANSVILDGPAGETARVVMVIGFSQPFPYTAPDGSQISTLSRLIAADDPFLANNALEVQTVDVVLTGGPQDITALFDFAAPSGALAFPGDDRLPVAFTSVVLDGAGNPAGPISAPIYLQPPESSGPDVTITVDHFADHAIDPIIVTVTYADPDGLDISTLELADLSAMSGAVSLDMLGSSLDVATDGLSASARYVLLPQDGSWDGDSATLSIAAGAVADLGGNTNFAATDGFTFTDPGGPVVDSLAEMTQLALQGVSLVNPTSIEVGADGRLYVSQQNGLIVALTVEKNTTPGPGGTPIETWITTAREDITLVQEMPNHSDTGVYEPGVVNRQVTGLVTTTNADGEIVIYVTSSDPRIGGGGSGDDKDLDTNSGILSRLTQQPDGSWEKLDLVRGLPRSEENHATNGIVLSTDPDGNEVLLLNVGGSTNSGAQSNNFAYTSEYYYSASVVSIDLGKLKAMEDAGQISTYLGNEYLYDLPTLDDITRGNDGSGGDLAGDGSTTADIFGGNDGLNQAIFDTNGIVDVVYSGFRNHYDIVVTPAGAVYTVDNGGNAGWGGLTVNGAGEVLLDTDGDGLADNGPGLNLANNDGPDNADSLLRLDDNVWAEDGTMYYGGHPNLYRAYGADAGVFLYADSTNPWGVVAGTPLDFVGGVLTPTATPVDLAPLISNADQISGVDALGQPLIDPQQAVQLGTGTRAEGLTDTPNGALYTFFSSTNGLDIYTGAGDLQGQLITVSFNGKIYALDIGPDGSVTAVEDRALTSSPLDVVTQGATDPYPGVIFVAAYGADQIVILSPDAGTGVTPDPNDRDQDGIDDTIDAFAADPDNGLLDTIDPGELMHWSFVNGETFPNERDSFFDGTGGLYNGGDIGWTGIMTNRGGLPETLYEQDNIIFGGAPGVLQVKEVEVGDATSDTQRNGFQLGTTIGEGTTDFTVSALIDNYLDDISSVPADEKLSQGIFIGAGDQNNFVSVSLVRLADGRAGFEVVSQFAFDFIGETPPQIDFYEVPDLLGAGSLDTLELLLDVEVSTGIVTPRWSYDLSGVTGVGAGVSVTLMGDARAALDGTLTLPDDSGGQVATGLAVGVVSSRSGSTSGAGGAPDTIAAISAGGDESFTATIDGVDITFIPDAEALNVTITGNSKTYGGSEALDVPNSELDELYTEERYASSGADWGYDIASGNGTFQIDLFFAETWAGAFASGVRVFDVLVEGAVMVDDFDIYAAAGSNSEYVISLEANVTDGVLDIDFDSLSQNAKVNGVLVRDMNTLAGSFAADWDYIQIEGFGTPPPDITPPSASIAITGGVVADDPVTVTLSYIDNKGLDPATITLSDLTITGPATYSILSEELSFAPNGTQATATYVVLQDGGWTEDTVTFDVAEDAISDTSGNGNPGATNSFTFGAPPPDTQAPLVTIQHSHDGTGVADDPVTVTLSYSDNVALDPATVELSDLAIIGAGTYTILSESLTFAPDNTSATATYSVLEDGGWSEGSVSFEVAQDAVTDTSGNGNTTAADVFDFDPNGDVFVFALNAGGDAYTATDGTVYAADTYGVGRSFTSQSPIAGTEDDILYQAETWNPGGFTYDIAMLNGIYRVDFHFAETYTPIDQPGERVFDVFLEDALVFDDLDILVGAGGPRTAYTVSAMVEVTDGSLTLRTSPEAQNPKINAFSVWIDEDMIA